MGRARKALGRGPPRSDSLGALGCNYENFNGTWIGVVVAPGVQLDRVVDYRVGTGLMWEYASPTYEELFGQPTTGERDDR